MAVVMFERLWIGLVLREDVNVNGVLGCFNERLWIGDDRNVNRDDRVVVGCFEERVGQGGQPPIAACVGVNKEGKR
jgi:hypothetical protein